MGAFNKVALRFPPSALSILPGAEVNFLTFVPRTFTANNVKGGFYDFVNFRRVRPEMQSPVLVAIVAGTFAKKQESRRDSAIVNQIVAQLRRSFPGLPSPIASAITRWSSDPFSLGAYSFMRPGSSRADYDELGKPVMANGKGWLWFAGEAAGSWPYPSQVHGAWGAGKRAAEGVLVSR